LLAESPGRPSGATYEASPGLRGCPVQERTHEDGLGTVTLSRDRVRRVGVSGCLS